MLQIFNTNHHEGGAHLLLDHRPYGKLRRKLRFFDGIQHRPRRLVLLHHDDFARRAAVGLGEHGEIGGLAATLRVQNRFLEDQVLLTCSL